MNVAEKIAKRIDEVDTAKKKAFEGIANCRTSDALSSLAGHVAHLEGRQRCLYDVQHSWGHKPEPGYLAVLLAGRVAQGADDGWSGRGNDLQRCKHDGYCEETRYWIQACEFAQGMA
jgi:hypothetical protein